MPTENDPSNQHPYPVQLDAELTGDLRRVNKQVNKDVRYAEDRDALRVPEFWEAAVPGGTGDCEDYALLKRDRLRALGWPDQALRLAVCRLDDGAHHAVLTVDTQQGTYVLCNNFAQPYGWADYTAYTGARWVSRQAATGSGWVSLAASNPGP